MWTGDRWSRLGVPGFCNPWSGVEISLGWGWSGSGGGRQRFFRALSHLRPPVVWCVRISRGHVCHPGRVEGLSFLRNPSVSPMAGANTRPHWNLVSI